MKKLLRIAAAWLLGILDFAVLGPPLLYISFLVFLQVAPASLVQNRLHGFDLYFVMSSLPAAMVVTAAAGLVIITASAWLRTLPLYVLAFSTSFLLPLMDFAAGRINDHYTSIATELLPAAVAFNLSIGISTVICTWASKWFWLRKLIKGYA